MYSSSGGSSDAALEAADTEGNNEEVCTDGYLYTLARDYLPLINPIHVN